MPRNVTPWWIKPETKDRLKAKGKYGESQDELINRILDELEVLGLCRGCGKRQATDLETGLCTYCFGLTEQIDEERQEKNYAIKRCYKCM
jgi:hypothetical protein